MILRTKQQYIYVSEHIYNDSTGNIRSAASFEDENQKQEVEIVKAIHHVMNYDFVPNCFQFDNKRKFKPLPVPQMNEQLGEYFPKPLENQWTFIMQDSETYTNPVYFYHAPIVQKALSGCQKDPGLDIGKLRFQREAVEDFALFGNAIRIVSNFDILHETDMQRILILHDFYQHPLALLDFIRSFQNQAVILPYLPDFFAIAAQHRSIQLIDVVECILDEILETLGFSIFDMIAQGTSSNIAIQIQSRLTHKCSLILCSPILSLTQEVPTSRPKRISEKQKLTTPLQVNEVSILTEMEHMTSYGKEMVIQTLQEEESDKKVQSMRTDENSKNMCNPEPLNERTISQYVCRSRKTSLFSVPSMHAMSGLPEVVNKVEQQVKAEKKPKMEPKVSLFQKLKNDSALLYQELVICDKEVYRVREQFQRGKSHYNPLTKMLEKKFVVDDNLGELFILLNDVIKYILHDQVLIQKLASIFKLSGLQIPTNNMDYFGIFNALSFQKFQLKKLMRFLYGILILAPLEYIEKVVTLQNLYDKQYFLCIDMMKEYLDCPVQVHPHQNIVVLVGTHDNMLNKDQLENLLFLEENYHNIAVRSLYACGHEFYTNGSVIMQRMIKFME